MKKRTTAWASPHGRRRRFLSVLLALALCLSLLPTTALAAQTGSSDVSRTVFDALGFDTKAPEGYEQEEGITATPFGKTYTTLAEVDELFVHNTNSNHNDGKNGNSESTTSLFGSGTATGGSLGGFFSSAKTYTAPNLSNSAILAVEGNFSIGNNGLKKDVVLLTYFARIISGTAYHYVRLYTGDPVNGNYSAAKRLTCSGGLGNSGDWTNGRLSEAYMAYNYLNLAVGDFDGDGIDEIATYVGSRTPTVTVWKLQNPADDGFLTPGSWTQAWSYDLPKTGGLIPNMVSLAAADIDKDGIDDLAISYGYYKYKGAAQASQAVVLMGADNSQMMTRSYTLPLGTVYRAGLTAGDIDNDGRSELMVGGSSSNTNRDARYLAIYGWNGTGFDKLAAQNINPTDGSSGLSDKYYMSLPYMAASLTVGKFYGLGDGPCIYMDSIILRYGTGGIEALDLADKHTNYFYGTDFEGVNDHLFYVEWSARAADFTGSGQEAVGVNRMSLWVDEKDRDNAHMFAYNAVNADTFKNQHLNILSFGGSGQSRTVSNVYHQYASPSGSEVVNQELDITPRAVPFCLPNTDDDTIVLRYTGEHSYTYADPEVLAVLASPPYYADLANDDDDSQMIESKTSYSSSHGSGSGSSYANSFSVGAYTSWEHTFSIFGVELFSAEAEASINNTFTWETQKSSSVEYEVEYATMAGLDTVVLYALPMETYVYEATMPDGTTQTMTVNLPYQPAVRTISLEEYAEIQAVYSDLLPDVSRALTHTVGDPGSYAPGVSALPEDRSQTLVYQGDFAAVGQGSQNTISQSIAMTSETENSFNYDFDVETKAGVGMGGVTVGITAGYSHGAGKVHVTTAGSSYSGEMNGLPTQAQQYGYGFNWKLVGFLYQGKYPVVTYLVNSVAEPPLLPENFGASEEDTSTDRIALEWDYPGNAAGFVIYRYFQSPSSSGYYKIGTVEGGAYTEVINGVKHYQFVDEGLSPNTGYQYRIQTIGLAQPNTSIPSQALSTYTKPEGGTPQVAVSAAQLAAYPDSKVSTTAYLENADEFSGTVYYQWQKQTARGSWEDLRNEQSATLTFQYPDLGVEGVYRCRVNALADQNLVTAHSPAVTVTFAQRASQITDLTISGNTLTAAVTGQGTSKPTGTVNFILTSGSAETIYTAQVGEDGKASVSISPVADIYKVTATYSGSKIFLPASYTREPLFYTSGAQSGSYVDVKDRYVYGDAFNFEKYTVTADGRVTKSALAPSDIGWTLPSGAGTDAAPRFSAGRAGWVGTAKFSCDQKTYTVNIVPRPIEIVDLADYTFAQGSGKSASDLWDKFTVSGLAEDWAGTDGFVKNAGGTYSALKLVIYDTAGDSYTPTAPGAYTAQFVKSSQNSNGNYTLTCPTVKLTITGRTYAVSAAVANGQDTWGSVAVAYPENATSAAVGQTVIFKATPNPGYAVKCWYLYDSGNSSGTPIQGSEGLDTLTMTQTKDGLNVQVEFQKKSNTLTVSAQPEPAGRVTTESKYFQNGNAYAAGYKAAFTAVPNDGWHFTGWEYLVSGQAPVYSEEDAFTVVMPDESVRLTAQFARDTYALTLSEGLEALAGGAVIADLTAIPGDTEVTVQPKAGYLLNEDAQWSVNGAALEPQPAGGSYTFTLLESTSVSAAVTAQTFDVALTMENVEGGTASLTGVTEDGKAQAGAQVVFAAEPSRGYDFQGWQDAASGATVSSDARYVLTVSGDVTLKPVFARQAGKTVTLSAGKNGSIGWTIEGVDAADDETVTLYPGETLTVTAQPRNGYMTAGWTVNEQYAADTAKTRTFKYQELTDGGTISVSFQPVTYFTVSFTGEITAAADGSGIGSGDSVAAGSAVVFTYGGSGTVTKWLNGADMVGGPGRTFTVPALSGSLDISVETGDLEFFDVADTAGTAEKHYTATVTGTYEEGGRYAANSSVTITLEPEVGWRITGVDCESADFTEENGIWTGTIEWLGGNVIYTVTVEEAVTPPAPGTAFTITFDPNGGTLSGSHTAQTNENGKLASLPTPARSGYTFNGWFTAAEGGDQVSADKVYTENTTLYAHWTEQSSTGGGGGGGGGTSAPPAYPVTPVKADGGSVSVNPSEAAKGDTVTITVTPGAGYQAGQVTVTDKNGKEIAVKDLGGGRYTFTMPGSKVTVSASFKAAGHAFTDVASSSYYADAVAWAMENGVTGGISADTFAPNAACTRAQAVTFLWRAAGCPEPQSAETAFTDVKPGSFYEKAVAWAVENGITKGTSDTAFSPDAPCSRGQIVTFLWRSQKSPAAGTATPFTDVKPGDYYADAVLWAVAQGVTNGTTDTTFSPGNGCTRAQIVTFLWRCMK